MSSLVFISLSFFENCVCLSPLGKLPSLEKLLLREMHTILYLDDDDDDEYHNGVEVRLFPSLKELSLKGLYNIKKLLKVERGEMFPCLSNLLTAECPNLDLPCLPYVKDLHVDRCNIDLLRSVSSFYGLTSLILNGVEDPFEDIGRNKMSSMAYLPDGMFRNLTCLQSLTILNLTKLKELPNELFELQNLKRLFIFSCRALESLPDGIRHLTSLEVLDIECCPRLNKRYKERSGEDWEKIAHIPKVNLWGP